jgi:hypothetical protein
MGKQKHQIESEKLIHYDFEDLTQNITIAALKSGEPGRILNAYIINGTVIKEKSYLSEKFQEDREKILAAILELLPNTIRNQLKDIINEYIIDPSKNIIYLWDQIKAQYQQDLSHATEKYAFQSNEYSKVKLLLVALSYSYVQKSWEDKDDAEALREDVVNLTGSVALVSALVLTM